VGRITRQKGVEHLLKAAAKFDPSIQLILCAGAPDTPEIAKQTQGLVAALRKERDGIFWVEEMLPRAKVQEVYTAADVSVCPSICEPLSSDNLGTMACESGVVASDVDGIPEVVQDGVAGTLVHYDEAANTSIEADISDSVNPLTLSR